MISHFPTLGSLVFPSSLGPLPEAGSIVCCEPSLGLHSSGQRCQMMFLRFVGATLPVWGSQPRVLLSPRAPVLPILPRSFPTYLFTLCYFLSFNCFDVAFTWYCDIYRFCFLLLFVDQPNIQLISYHHLIGWELEVPQNLSSVLFNHLWRHCPIWSWHLQPTW